MWSKQLASPQAYRLSPHEREGIVQHPRGDLPGLRARLPDSDKCEMNKACARALALTYLLRHASRRSSGARCFSQSSDGGDQQRDAKTASDKLKDLLATIKTTKESSPAPENEPVTISTAPNRRKRPSPKPRAVVPEIDAEMSEAVTDVAEHLGGDTHQTESELLQRLRESKQSDITGDFRNMLASMKVQSSEELNRAELVRGAMERQQKLPVRSTLPVSTRQKVKIFGGKPLGIFKKPQTTADEDVLKTWSALHQREIEVVHSPVNGFEEMILWTNQKKLWHFPIDNEQGLEEEKDVGFEEHIFLDNHLEPWCPKSGPIRHFMELVCVGLSKSPYLTAQMKKDHILWYRDYFQEKQELLKQVGALPA